jgi:hypothetical protein
MNRDQRIKRVGKGEFRSRLAVEDVLVERNMEFYSLVNKFGKMERVLVLSKDPIPSPLMQYMFYLKITSVTDKYLKKLIHDLMYINPAIDQEGLVKMTSFIIRALVYQDPDSKEYKLSYEQVHPVVLKESTLAELDGVEVYADKVVLFERNTMMTGKERQVISTQSRSYRDSFLSSEIIHNKAIQLVGQKDLYAVSKGIVHKEVKNNRGLKSLNTFNKHIADKTVKILKDSLEERRFRTPREAEQFEVYKVYREKKMTTAQMVSAMGVSFSTLAFFSRVFKEFKNRVV